MEEGRERVETVDMRIQIILAATLLDLEYIQVVWSRRGNTRLLLSEGTGQVDVEGCLDSLNSLYLIRPLTTELQLANHCVREGGGWRDGGGECREDVERDGREVWMWEGGEMREGRGGYGVEGWMWGERVGERHGCVTEEVGE